MEHFKYLLPYFKIALVGLPWWSSGWDSVLPVHGAWVQSLFPHAAAKSSHATAEFPCCKWRLYMPSQKRWKIPKAPAKTQSSQKWRKERIGRIESSIEIYTFSSVQFSSVTQSCLTLCDPMNRSMPGLPVHHQVPEFTQTHVHRVGDAIQPSHPLSSPSPPAPNPSQHQGLFQWVNSVQNR